MNEEENTEELDVRSRHLQEVFSRRTEEQRILILHQSLDKLREELFYDEHRR